MDLLISIVIKEADTIFFHLPPCFRDDAVFLTDDFLPLGKSSISKKYIDLVLCSIVVFLNLSIFNFFQKQRLFYFFHISPVFSVWMVFGTYIRKNLCLVVYRATFSQKIPKKGCFKMFCTVCTICPNVYRTYL